MPWFVPVVQGRDVGHPHPSPSAVLSHVTT